jgi:hypothetical protein
VSSSRFMALTELPSRHEGPEITQEAYVQLVRTIFNGTGVLYRGIHGGSDFQTRQLRAEWLIKRLPKTALLLGASGLWDGVPRLAQRLNSGNEELLADKRSGRGAPHPRNADELGATR